MINIIKVQKEDIYEVKELLRNIWLDTYESILSEEVINKVTTIWHDPKILQAECESKDTLFIIAKNDNNKFIGVASAKAIDDKIIILSRFYVKKEYQGAGIGNSLLNYIVNEFPSAQKIKLEVAVGNLKAIRFYNKNGFVVVSSKNEEIDNEHIGLTIMEKYI